MRFATIEVSNPIHAPHGLTHITVRSECLGGRGDMSVFLPDQAQGLADLPVVMLLHGVRGSHWFWSANLGVHHVFQQLVDSGSCVPMALVMPSDGGWGDGTAYLRHVHADYERWIVEDVPAAVMEVIPNVSARSKRFLGGFSMGGYGALRLGAKHCHLFNGISAQSSITDFPQMQRFATQGLSTWKLAENGDLSALGWIVSNRDRLPPLRFDCGEDDLLIRENRQLHEDLEATGIAHTYEELPGAHAREYWTKHIDRSLRFFSGLVTSAHPR